MTDAGCPPLIRRRLPFSTKGNHRMKKTSITNRIIWIILAFAGWYILVGEMAVLFFDRFIGNFYDRLSNEMVFVLEMYTSTLPTIIVFLLVCVITRKNRFMLEVLKPTAEKKSMSKLGMGLLLGFLTNFFCIACALLHGDIKLYYDFSLTQIPFMLFALVSVFFQSSSEEIWTRTFLYERINIHYPLWVAIIVNGTLFGLLHSFNPGITALAMADLILCGIFYSLLRWYSGSIWTCMGIHTMWNYTQNLIFGLPNSGLVSEASIFHMGASSGTSNLIYSYEFGVEGALPALFMEVLPIVIIILLAKRDGRLGELLLSKEKTGEVDSGRPEPDKYIQFSE